MTRWMRALVTWVTWLWSRGRPMAGIQQTAAEQFPERSPAELDEAFRWARLGIGAALAANRLRPSDQLSQALGGATPPQSDVEARVLVEMINVRGEHRWRTIRVNTQWTDTLATMLDVVEGVLRNWLGQSSGTRVISVSVIPPLIVGR